MKLNSVTALLFGGVMAAGLMMSSCGYSKKELEQMHEDAWKYRDSVYSKDPKVFFDNSLKGELKIPDKPQPIPEFYWKWKNLNDSLNVVKKYRINEAISIYKSVR